jgi:peroxiredoxin
MTRSNVVSMLHTWLLPSRSPRATKFIGHPFGALMLALSLTAGSHTAGAQSTGLPLPQETDGRRDASTPSPLDSNRSNPIQAIESGVDSDSVATLVEPILDISGRRVSWNGDQPLRVLAFLGCECPVARLYAKRLQELHREYAPRGVQFIGVMSNLHDSIEDIQHFQSTYLVDFPLAKDGDQRLAKLSQATRTAEVIVVDSAAHVVYRGRIDDQYAPGIKRARSTRHELRDAIDRFLAGQTPEIQTTEPVGCLIAWDKAPESTGITYANSVASILYRHCYECHRPGEIGPFDISNANEIKGWADMILEVIDDGRMPPWHADPAHGSFKNSRSMTRAEIDTLRQWVRDGAPLGDLATLPPPPELKSGWRMERTPDLIAPMKSTPYRIPATGTVDYQYFVVDPKITEDRWVSAAQVIPGNTAVVHHAIVFIRPPDDQPLRGISWLTAYVPGQMATRFPAGYARHVPAGSKLVFQMHYTPNGEETTDLSQVGMTFLDASEVTHEVFTLLAIDQDFEIPPNAPGHEVTARVPYLPQDAELLTVSPHMHLRGRSFELRTTRDQAVQTLLRVPRYDFNWQHVYEFTQPLPLRDIDTLEFTARFDNSTDNPFNPAPDEYVMWGDQTWEEMAVAFFEVARPRRPVATSPTTATATDRAIASLETSASSTISKSTSPAAEAFADRFLSKLDRNGDGEVQWEEASQVVKDRSFSTFDRDGNGRITRDELIQSMADPSKR